jgi:hypothetical protein
VGALGIVSGEFAPGVEVEKSRSLVYHDEEWADYYWSDDYDPEGPVVVEACAYLSLVINPEEAFYAVSDGVPSTSHYEWVEHVIDWNDQDNRTRKQVLKVFEKAAALAARPGSFDAVARKYLTEKGFNFDEDEN